MVGNGRGKGASRQKAVRSSGGSARSAHDSSFLEADTRFKDMATKRLRQHDWSTEGTKVLLPLAALTLPSMPPYRAPEPTRPFTCLSHQSRPSPYKFLNEYVFALKSAPLQLPVSSRRRR